MIYVRALGLRALAIFVFAEASGHIESVHIEEASVPSDCEVSLLQTDLRLVETAVHRPHRPETVSKAKATQQPEASFTEAKASRTARSLAWAKAKVGDSSAIVGFMVLLGAIAFCVSLMFFSGLSNQDSDSKGAANGLRPQGVGDPRIPSNVSMPRTPSMSMTTPGGSQLPSQQILQQRTPQGSSVGGRLSMPMQEEASMRPDDTSEVPPICPSLILPHTEARFMINMGDLKRSSPGAMDVLGTSGRKLLHALVCDSPDGRRCLMLASCGCEDDPRVCVFTPQQGMPSQAFEVFGKGGKFYGWIESSSSTRAMLSYSGNGGMQKPVLQIEMGNKEDLRMSASAMDGRLLASAGRNVGVGGKQFEGIDSWKMQVKPGVDAVLVTSCMLALILLRPQGGADERFSMGASTANGTATSLRPLR